MRHLVLAGEHPVEAWARFPGPRGWVPALIGAVAVSRSRMWIAALSDAVGSICIWVTGVGAGQWWGRPFWGGAVILATMALTLVQTYDVLERVSFGFLALKILFVPGRVPGGEARLAGRPCSGCCRACPTYSSPGRPRPTRSCRAGRPSSRSRRCWDRRRRAHGTTWATLAARARSAGAPRPRRPAVPTACPWARSRCAEAAPGCARPRSTWSRRSLAVFVMTGLFMPAGRALLHPQHQVPTNADLYGKQAQFLGVVHPALVHVYKAGIFFAMLGAVYGCFEVYARTLFEPVRALWPHREWSLPRLRFWNTLYCGLGAPSSCGPACARSPWSRSCRPSPACWGAACGASRCCG